MDLLEFGYLSEMVIDARRGFLGKMKVGQRIHGDDWDMIVLLCSIQNLYNSELRYSLSFSRRAKTIFSVCVVGLKANQECAVEFEIEGYEVPKESETESFIIELDISVDKIHFTMDGKNYFEIKEADLVAIL